jgi:hypothetical protein
VPGTWDHRADVLPLWGRLDGLPVADAKRLKALGDENRRPKKLVAGLSLDNAMLASLHD